MAKARISFLAWLLMAGTGIFLFCWIAASLQHPGDARAEAATNSKLEQQRVDQVALADSVTTPKTFQARCGAPSRIVHINDGTEFIYSKSPTEMHVIFTGDKDVPIEFREHLHSKVYSFKPYDGLVEMGCVKK